jgi:hypothetical protein
MVLRRAFLPVDWVGWLSNITDDFDMNLRLSPAWVPERVPAKEAERDPVCISDSAQFGKYTPRKFGRSNLTCPD